MACPKSLIGPHGTEARSQRAIHSAASARAHSASRMGSSAAKSASRSELVTKRGSVTSSGRSSTSVHRRSQVRWLAAPIMMKPMRVSNA
ncbi:hypothetical protein G6F65_023419 [Rhizopus arrhizus]|nr:hypothetical protein G6F65_023419 [Rhizopus arrhizus]